MSGAFRASVRKGAFWSTAEHGRSRPALRALLLPGLRGAVFGMLIPLAVTHDSVLTLPGVYGLATGIPVAIFAGAIAFGAERVGAMFAAAGKLERWFRPARAVVLILIGIYESLRSIFGVI